MQFLSSDSELRLGLADGATRLRIDNQVVSTPGRLQAQGGRPVNPQTGTTYTLAASDAGGVVTFTGSSGITLTVPTIATAGWSYNPEVEIIQLGSGTVTISAASGVTIVSLSSYVALSGQGAHAVLKMVAPNYWVLTGDLAS